MKVPNIQIVEAKEKKEKVMLILFFRPFKKTATPKKKTTIALTKGKIVIKLILFF
jgi:hypothetical protein